MSQYRSLWLTVICTAIKDACSDRQGLDKENAENWLMGNSKDFQKVCELANVMPHRIRRAYLEIKGGRKMVSFPEMLGRYTRRIKNKTGSEYVKSNKKDSEQKKKVAINKKKVARKRGAKNSETA